MSLRVIAASAAAILSLALHDLAHASEAVTSTTTSTATADAEGLLEGETFDDSVFDDDAPPRTRVDGDEGSPFLRHAEFVEAIEVIGNAKTERAVIMRRLLVGVGDLIDESKIEQSRLRLLNTGYFKSVEFSLRRGSERGRVLLVVEVVERNTVLIDQLYYGFSPVTKFFGGLGLVETNFLGKGVSASAAFVAGGGRRGADVHLFVPDLSNTPLQLSASALFLQGAEVVDDQADPFTDLTYERIGGTVGIGIGVGPAQRVSLDYRLESVSAGRLPNLDPIVLRRAPSVQFGDSVLSSLSLTYERDTRDDPFVPTQGARIALGVETGTKLLGSTYEFSKYTAELQQAFSIVRRHSLIVRLFGGFIQGQAPFFNQFFVNDYAYFVIGRDSLPRNLQLNFSESNDYDDLIVSLGADYSIPIQEGGAFLYRTFVYAGVDVSSTASLDELQEDPDGRALGGDFPVSVDLGLKLDTAIGNFTLSLAYLGDLAF
ncbi:BamA/TamA family outer membrane protein [Myxococcota bacterium]|nr:BamA/TamA family outer membrane protein [Myxococcota bacterium]